MCPISGGNWNNEANAGVWALNCNNVRGNSNVNVGGRADSDSPRIRVRNGGTQGDVFLRVSAKSECIRLSGRAGHGIEGQAR
jgi:hypothetical protein